MTRKLPIVVILALGLTVAACSDNSSAPEAESDAESSRALDADDDTLEPELPKIEEGAEHNEAAPHTH
jgi:hypothetical protein